MDLAQLQQTLRQFAAERDWQEFHTPKNLAMALMVEAAELAEIFQWMTPEQSRSAAHDKVEQDRIGDEVADVLLYLLQIADHCGIDLKRAVGRKLVKNAKKHPPTKPGLPAGPALTSTPATHVLVDWENVQPKDTDIRALVPDVSDVWIFHGRQQKKVDAHQQSFADRLMLVPVSRPGKNALDFHLSFYMGYITSRNPEARIVVLSNDQGYGPMLDHAKELGFDARQMGFARAGKSPAAKKKAPATTVAKKKASPAAKKEPTKKATVKATAQAPVKAAATKVPTAKPTAPEPKVPVKKKAKTASPQTGVPTVSEKDYTHVIDSLRKAKNKPARVARLKGAVKSLINGGKADAGMVDAVIQRMVAEGHVNIDGQGGVKLTR